MEFDGRFEENHEKNSSHVQHALTLLEFIEEKNRRHKTFCDVTMKMMYAQILAAVGYAYLRGRILIEDGQKRLLSARDELCSLTSSYQELIDQQLAEEDQAGEIGMKLYRGLKELIGGDYYEHHVATLPIYQRLTQRDFASLDLKPRDLKHLEDNEELENLRRDERALSKDVMIRIYACELVASIFCMLARMASFHIAENNKEDVLKHSIKNTQIARAIYDKITAEHGIIVLNKVIAHREELHSRLELIERQANDERNIERLNLIMQEAKDLSEQNGRAYEFGLLRSTLGNDNYNRILCNEMMMRTSGLLYRHNRRDEYLQQGKALFDDCVQRAEDESKKNDCLSNANQQFAMFLSTCEQPHEAVHRVIVSIHILVGEGSVNNEEVVNRLKKGRFLELCKLLEKYAKDGGKPSEGNKEYIKNLAIKCEENLLKDRAKILRKVLSWQVEQPVDQELPTGNLDPYGVPASDQ